MGNGFNDTTVGGSPKCYELYVGAHRKIEQELKTTDGQMKLGT